MTLMRYTIWHGRSNGAECSSWAQEAEEALQNNTWTTPLYIDGAGWENDALREDAGLRLFQALGANTSTSTLIFQNAALNTEMQAAFSQAMDQNNHLSSLTLRNLKVKSAIDVNNSNNNTNNNDQQQQAQPYHVPASVFLNPQLESLSLAKTYLNEQACRNLSEMIRESTSLTSLALEAVQMDREGLLAVLAAVIMSRSLTTLKLNNLSWSKVDIQRFLMAASFNRTITKLSLESMDLDASDATNLAMFLQRNKTVTELSLRKNCLDAAALRVLVPQGLLQNTTLEKLYLSRNCLGDESSKHLCKLLTESTSLRELCLVETKLMQRACTDIANALRYNTGLRSISMDGNHFEACGQELLETLQHNVHLTSVLDRLPSLLARQQRKGKGSSNDWKQVDFYLRANKAHRRFVKEDTTWRAEYMPKVLESAGTQSDVLFHLFRSGSNYIPTPSAHNKRHPDSPPRTFCPSPAAAAATTVRTAVRQPAPRKFCANSA